MSNRTGVFANQLTISRYHFPIIPRRLGLPGDSVVEMRGHADLHHPK
jgi:hypothetical protein